MLHYGLYPEDSRDKIWGRELWLSSSLRGLLSAREVRCLVPAFDGVKRPGFSGGSYLFGRMGTTAMTHIAVQEALDDRNFEWLGTVSDAKYLAGPPR